VNTDLTPPPESKLLSLGELAARAHALRGRGKRVVYCRGRFDLLNAGHIQRLEAARREGDVLVVTVRADRRLRADDNPAILDEDLRARTVASIACVDMVAVDDMTSPDDTLQLIAPDACIEGVDADAAPPRSGDGDGLPFSQPARTFLRDFRGRWSAEQVIEKLGDLKKLRALVVGDTIIDEYHFVRPYGMPLKAPIVASQFLSGEAHAGGILAVANHIAGFCGQVDLVTSLGAQDTREDFVRQHLRANVNPTFLYHPNAPTTVKRRYVRRFLVQKLFEVSFFNDQPLPRNEDVEACHLLESKLRDYDVVVVADFGQGFISRNMIEVLCRQSRFLAINAQMNSINMGFHVVTRYPRADYVCIDEEESRLACRDRTAPAQDLVLQLQNETQCSIITVTRGHHGSMTYTPEGGIVEVPVLSREVVDTVGAGDAYLAVTAPCAALGYPPELIGFIGNSVGAIAVRILGNQQPVAPEALFDQIRTFLK